MNGNTYNKLYQLRLNDMHYYVNYYAKFDENFSIQFNIHTIEY